MHPMHPRGVPAPPPPTSGTALTAPGCGLLKQMRDLRAQAARLVAEHNRRQRQKRRSAANPSTPTDGDPSNGR